MIGLHNISAYVDHHARERPHQRAVVFPESRERSGRYHYSQLTYAQLKALTDAYAAGFHRMGLARGDRVSVFLKPSLDFPAVTFALFKVGAVPVFIDPGMGRKQALSCVQRMKPRALVAIPLLHALRPLFADNFRSVELSVTGGSSTGWWGGETLESLRAGQTGDFETTEMDPDEEAAILFTSGSTGPAKGVRYTHRIYDAQVRYIQEMYGIEPGEIDVAGFPLFGLFTIAMGVTTVFADVDPTKIAKADPTAVVQNIQDLSATSAFGSPTLWAIVARHCAANDIKLPTLKRVLSAGAPIPVWLHESFKAILSGGEIHTPYGATESLPVASIGSDEVLADTAARTREGAGTCVGRPAPGITLKIIGITDEAVSEWSDALVLPDGEIGEICVTGEVATRSYVDAGAANKKSKIRDGARVWHRIGDLGYFDDQGRLWFCGRKAHRVQTSAGLVCSSPVEGVLNEEPGVARTALIGIGQAPDQEPVIVIELEDGADKASVERAVLARAAANEVTAPIKRALFHPGFPTDVRHNAKIKREVLTEWAQRGSLVPRGK